MKVARIPLKEYSRFHFGELKMDDNLALSTSSYFAHSDTLFSGLVHAFSKYNGNAQDFADKFINGEIIISSQYYYLQKNNTYIYFLPKPVFVDINSPKSKDGLHKVINNIQFVSVGVWNNGFEAEKWASSNGGYRIIDNLFVLTNNEYNSLNINENLQIIKNVLLPKSPIRAHINASIFYQADIEIGQHPSVEIGMYFLYVADVDARLSLEIATNIMAYSGIGGEINNTGRTVKGNPEFESFELLPQSPKHSNSYFVNLSLFCPIDEDDFNKAKHYSTILRGGRRLGSGGNAKVIRMIGEGAVLTDIVKGRIVEIGKDLNGYAILRNGHPLLIPISNEY